MTCETAFVPWVSLSTCQTRCGETKRNNTAKHFAEYLLIFLALAATTPPTIVPGGHLKPGTSQVPVLLAVVATHRAQQTPITQRSQTSRTRLIFDLHLRGDGGENRKGVREVVQDDGHRRTLW